MMNNPKTILVIDDDPTVLHLLDKQLQAQGYTVLTAGEGRTGFELAVEKQPDLILLDIMIPDKSGGQVAEILAQDEGTKDIPIVFISVLLDAAGRKRIEVNDREYRAVSKPFYFPELLAQIRKALNESQSSSH